MEWELPLTMALVGLVMLVVLGIRRVPSGETHTVHRLGRFHRTLAPGFHYVVPMVDRIRHKVSMLGRVVGFTSSGLITRDRRRFTASGALYFQVLDPRRAAGRVSTLDDATEQLAREALVDTVEQLEADALTALSSADLNAWLLGRLNDGAVHWGVRITRVEIQFRADDAAESVG